MIRALLSLLLVGVIGTAARADIILYQIPGTNLVTTLQGRYRVLPGKTVSFKHPKFSETLYLGLEDIIKRYEVPSPNAAFTRQLGKAVNSKDPEKVMEAANLALRQGLLPQFYEAIDEVLKLDPSHNNAQNVLELKRLMAQQIGSSSAEEAILRSTVPNRGMKIALSNHFILLHDTPEKPIGRRRKPRAVERLDLLELVYEGFLLKFYSQGIELEVPKERLMVVLFNDYQDFMQFSVAQSPELASAAGFWNSKTNISFFFDHGTTEEFQDLQQLARKFQGMADDAKRAKSPATKDLVRMANNFSLLFDIAQEDADINVVTHEATHQMAGNTGLLPRDVMIPSWVHEGLATYFESPKEASWAGIGSVNEQRLKYYRALERDRSHSNIEFIVGDQIFDYARSHGATLHGYGQAWALTHFLMERHLSEFIQYYKRLGEMPPDLVFSSEVLNSVFDEVFGEDRRGLDAEWRAYMRSLKTDLEIMLDD